MATKIYDLKNKQLIFIRERADQKFWDAHWRTSDIKATVTRVSKFNMVARWTKRYLKPSDGPILEGGCGIGQNVQALQNAGYTCTGIDFAAETVEKVNYSLPALDIRYGDIRHLDFEAGTFAAYWSLGVIEHFEKGYSDILIEAKRVLRPGGYLFLTFPYMSPLRAVLASRRKYPHNMQIEDKKDFYQYALNHRRVMNDATGVGLRVVKIKPIAGIKGFKDECHVFRKFLQRIFDYSGKSFVVKTIRSLLDEILARAGAGHVMLLVLQCEQ